MAGNIPAPWVLDHRDRIRATAQLRAAVEAPDAGPAAEGADARPSTSRMAAITCRAGALRARTGGEALPLLLDEPLADLDGADKAPVLEFLGRLARHHQVVVVTADSDVLSWARLEAMTGSVGITSGPAIGDGATTTADAGRSTAAADRPADPSPQGTGPGGGSATT
jgi:hypothetical protein